jgi:hypothetical protein
MFEIPGMPGAQIGMVNLGDMLGKAFGGGARKIATHDGGRRRTIRWSPKKPTSCSTTTRSPRRDRQPSSRTASCSSTRSTRSAPAANIAAAAM